MNSYQKYETEDSAAIARETFSYDAESGFLTRLNVSKYTKYLEGKPVGTKVGRDSGCKYLQTLFNGRLHFVHRIAWLLYYSSWPDGLIDHEDGDGLNNRISNLRVVPVLVNMKNKRRYVNNKSGHTGVHWCKDCNKWVAGISSGGKRITLGRFSSVSDAIECRKSAEMKYDFHRNNGNLR